MDAYKKSIQRRNQAAVNALLKYEKPAMRGKIEKIRPVNNKNMKKR